MQNPANLPRKSPPPPGRITLLSRQHLLRQEVEPWPGTIPLIRSAGGSANFIPPGWKKTGINYAKHLFATDPDKGFPTAVETLKTQSKKRRRMIGVEHHSGGGASSTRQADTETLMQQLIDHDANALMEDLMPSPEQQDHSKLFDEAGREWAESNFEAYRDWVDEHPANPAVYETGILNVLNHLRKAGHHREGMAWISEVAVGLLKTDSGRAAQWVRALPKGSARSRAIKNLYRNWRNYEPDHAEEFLRSFPPEDRK